MKPTGIALDTLKHVGNVFSAAPGGDFKVHGGKKKDDPSPTSQAAPSCGHFCSHDN